MFVGAGLGVAMSHLPGVPLVVVRPGFARGSRTEKAVLLRLELGVGEDPLLP